MGSILKRFSRNSRKIIFWNMLAFIFVKFIFSSSTFQLAQISETSAPFDSREVIALTNKARVDANLSPLQTNYKLDAAAQEKLNDMANKGYFAHVSPSGVTPWFWMKDVSYKYTYAGENIAVGFPTAGDTVTAWMNSPSHKENILNKNYREIGIAVGRANVGGIDGILVVQMFGNQGNVISLSPTSSPKPSAMTAVKPVGASSHGKAGGAEITPEQNKLSYISTDSSIAPATGPKKADFQNGLLMEMISYLFNDVYVILALFLAVMSILSAMFYERSRAGLLTATVQVVILVLAIVVPSLGATLQGLVF